MKQLESDALVCGIKKNSGTRRRTILSTNRAPEEQTQSRKILFVFIALPNHVRKEFNSYCGHYATVHILRILVAFWNWIWHEEIMSKSLLHHFLVQLVAKRVSYQRLNYLASFAFQHVLIPCWTANIGCCSVSIVDCCHKKLSFYWIDEKKGNKSYVKAGEPQL